MQYRRYKAGLDDDFAPSGVSFPQLQHNRLSVADLRKASAEVDVEYDLSGDVHFRDNDDDNNSGGNDRRFNDGFDHLTQAASSDYYFAANATSITLVGERESIQANFDHHADDAEDAEDDDHDEFGLTASDAADHDGGDEADLLSPSSHQVFSSPKLVSAASTPSSSSSSSSRSQLAAASSSPGRASNQVYLLQSYDQAQQQFKPNADVPTSFDFSTVIRADAANTNSSS